MTTQDDVRYIDKFPHGIMMPMWEMKSIGETYVIVPDMYFLTQYDGQVY